jgi:hypothetical protein
MIVEIELSPDIAGRLARLVESAATGDIVGVAAHPELRRQTRNQLVAEALTRWLPDAAVFDPDVGLRLNPERPRPTA